ncbi:hypothetical protein ACQ4M3_41710 [Leptolyngbya sp. AN03gr2]
MNKASVFPSFLILDRILQDGLLEDIGRGDRKQVGGTINHRMKLE